MLICKSASENHIDQILEIANVQFGNHYLLREELEDYIFNASKCVDIVVNKDDEVLAFNMVNTLYNRLLSDKIIKKQNQIIGFFPDKCFVHWHKILCVKKGHQGKKLGTMLYDYTYNRIHPITEFWLGISWAPSLKANIEGLYKSRSFIYKMRIENYWYEDSFLKGYNCASCGKPPCECTAFIFIRK